MPYNLVHAGGTLQRVDVGGGVSTLTLPAGVTMSTTLRTRFAVIEGYAVATNGPIFNCAINTNTLAVVPLSLTGPTSIPTVAAGAAGVLTGVYSYKVTFAEMSGSAVVSESPFVGPTADVTVSAQKVSLASIPLSTQASVTSRRIYRTSAGGAVYFFLATIGDNTTTTYSDNTADAGLATTAAPTDLGNPQGTTNVDRLVEIVTWGDRLWARGSTDPDIVAFSGVNKYYAWNATQTIAANPVGQEPDGIVAFLPRRTELGIGKRSGLWKISGNSEDTYQCQQFWHGAGVKAAESVVVIDDTVYWLSDNGVYSWGPGGIVRMSERVDAWFTSGRYFNRDGFANAFARHNTRENTYELHLPSVSSAVNDRWVSYDVTQQRWLGPHKTDAFTPTAAGAVQLSGGVVRNVIGSASGALYISDGTWHMDSTSAIALSVRTGWHSGGAPELSKVFGQLSVSSGVESAGTLVITPYVGGTDAAAGPTLSHNLTTGEERLDRLGIGRLVSLQFDHAVVGEPVRLYGYSIPVVPIGVR